MIYGTGGRLQKVRSLGRRTKELGARRMLLLGKTFGLLLLARVALQVVPVRKIMAWQQRPLRVKSRAEAEELEVVRHAVLVAARYSPVRFICFPQCLAASALLRARGIESRLHFGVTRDEGRLVTHTWIEAAGKIVIGGEVAGKYTELAVY